MGRDGAEDLDFGEDLELLEVVDFREDEEVSGVFDGAGKELGLTNAVL